MNKKEHKKIRKVIKAVKKEVKENMVKYLIQEVYPLKLWDRIKIAWVIIRRG